jgi:aspartate carbamoyltransferase regulatory subunit
LDVALLGYIDPNITVCTIKDYQIHSKTKMKLPDLISGIIRCRNPRCITSQETVTEHQFRLTDKEKRVYRCVYCETD